MGWVRIDKENKEARSLFEEEIVVLQKHASLLESEKKCILRLN